MNGCLLAIISLFMPRLIIFGIYLFTDWISLAYETAIWPFLGFLFMPFTTLAYMAAMLHGGLEGWWIVILIVAVLADMSGSSHSTKQ